MQGGARYADARVVQRRTQAVATRNGEHRHARRRGDAGNRRSRPRRIGVGLRLRPPAFGGRRRRGGGAGARVRAGQLFARAREGRARPGASPRPASSRPRWPRIPSRCRSTGSSSCSSQADRELAVPGHRRTHDVRPGVARGQRLRVLRRRRDDADVTRVRAPGSRPSRAATTDGSRCARTRPPTAARARRPDGSTSESLGLAREAPRVAEEALALLAADPCPAGVTTLVLDAEQTGLQLHESVGHPARARPDLRDRGRVRRDELGRRGRGRHAPLRLGAHERRRGLDDARRPRHVRLGRRGRARRRASRSSRRGVLAGLPLLARVGRAARGAAPAARCARTAGAGCRSCA